MAPIGPEPHGEPKGVKRRQPDAEKQKTRGGEKEIVVQLDESRIDFVEWAPERSFDGVIPRKRELTGARVTLW